MFSILYVEDNTDLRESIGMLMEADGREVVLCATAEEASAVCEARRFDVVITDESLPGMSGSELASRLLAADPLQWIVLCSGYDMNSKRLGANVRSLPKPFDLDVLESLLASIAQDLAQQRRPR
jgi:two-component system, cell cycle response regulator CpdR